VLPGYPQARACRVSMADLHLLLPGSNLLAHGPCRSCHRPGAVSAITASPSKGRRTNLRLKRLRFRRRNKEANAWPSTPLKCWATRGRKVGRRGLAPCCRKRAAETVACLTSGPLSAHPCCLQEKAQYLPFSSMRLNTQAAQIQGTFRKRLSRSIAVPTVRLAHEQTEALQRAATQ
jgi:hypothetical protein